MKMQVSPYIILFIAAIAIFTGCKKGADKGVENDIKFETITVDKTYHMMNNQENPNCNLQLSFTYPARYENSEVLKKIQQEFIRTYFGDNYEEYAPEEAVVHYTDDYLQAYQELETDFRTEIEKDRNAPVSAWFSYYEMSSNQIAFNHDNIISYTVNFENYTGGAHGAHAYTNHVIDLRTGDRITEDDIFIENFQDTLAQILVDKIAEQNNVENPNDLENIGYFSVEEIYPNNNFLIDENGITYTFNEYEIAAYVIGATNVHLSYDEVRHLLRKNSPVSLVSGI
ncbi:MAG: DUF3298 and DUF4163 domain-containing protein [Tannerellaceae bacterium]|nr:DUF3298 and DUF4163 domain-containing protein [Tannerellaceae bacterium]